MKKIFFIFYLLITIGAFAQKTKSGDPEVYAPYVATGDTISARFNVLRYGAKGDGKLSKDGAITSGSHTLTSATIGFSASDVGKTIKVGGAAASNANLLTTISGFTNSTTVTLTAAAGATVSSADIKYGTDNSTFVQAAINAAAANGGGRVIVPTGIYFFSTEVSSDGNGHNLSTNAHIYMPYYAYRTPQTMVTVEIEGEQMPNQYTNYLDTTTGAIDMPYTATLFWSLSNNTTAMVSSADSTSSVGSWTFGYMKINNIGFRTQSRINNIDTPGKMTAVDASGIAMFSIDNYRIDNESPLQNNAPASTAYGIKLPIVGNWARVDIGRGIIQHYYVGVSAGEHATFNNPIIAGCYKGLSVEGAQNHDIHVNRIGTYWNKYNISITAKCFLKIVDWDIEDYTGSAVGGQPNYWFNVTSDLYEPSNTNSFINVMYHRIVSFVNGQNEYGFLSTISSPATQVQVQSITGSNWYSDLSTNTNYIKSMNQTANSQSLITIDHSLTTWNTNGFTNLKKVYEKFPGASKSAYIIPSWAVSGIDFSSDSGNMRIGGVRYTDGAMIGGQIGLFSNFDGSLPGNVYLDAGSGSAGSINLRTGSQNASLTVGSTGNVSIDRGTLTIPTVQTTKIGLAVGGWGIEPFSSTNLIEWWNGVFDGSNLRYIATGFASAIQFGSPANGDLSFRMSTASGSAGGVIAAFTNSLTMKNTTGNVLIGSVSGTDDGNNALQVTGSIAASTNITATNGNLTLGTAGNKIVITEGTNGRVGQTTLVSGTKAITISGLTTNSRAFVTLVTPTGTTLTTTYQGVCTTNTLTIQANVAAGTINTADGSVVNYFVIN